MRLSEDKIRRIAERLHDELAERGLVAYRDPRTARPSEARAARVKQIYDAIVDDLRIEEEIDQEAERIVDSYSRSIRGTERDILMRKHKEEIARRRGYVL
jgi:hypothetical protein